MAIVNVQGPLLPGPIAPVARLGERVVVKRVQSYYMYDVMMTESLPKGGSLVVNLLANAQPTVATIAAGVTVSTIPMQTPMEMDGYEMGQWRFRLLDDFQIRVYEPISLPRFVVKNARATISKWGQVSDPDDHQTELFVWQDEWPGFDVINPTAFTLATCRIALYGYRYRMKRTTQTNGDGSITVIPAQQDLSGFGNLAYTGVMGEGFAGTGFERAFN